MSTEPSHKIVIVGGGTAGWMAALIMARNWLTRGVEITLLESPDVGIIGVGEGSTPTLKKFFKDLDIPESEWMPECNATYKCGINFDKWSTKPGFENYFHPFASSVDQHTLPLFMQHAQARQQGINLDAHPNRFFLAAHLAAHNLAPKHSQQENFPILYGYHFDAVLLGQFLRKKAIAMGVFYRSCHVQAVTLNEQGDISAVTTKEGDTIGANFFVDCTGFNSLLLQQHLKVDFNSFGNNLFNDAAVAMPSSITEKIPSQTISTALNNGWAWKIPLTNRFGNGYVYSSAFCSANDAELELRTHLGLLDADIPVRHLKMKVGQVQQHWAKNCLAVGLSQGFIEPLEATALYLVQQTAEIFVEAYEKGNFSSGYRAAFNKRISDYFEGTRDYIVTHYKTSSRTDTAYWRANTEDQTAVSDKMKNLYNAWMTGKNIAEEIKHLGLEQYYPAPSWYCILAGMGIFAPIEKLRAPRAEELQYDLRKVDNYLSTTAQHFFDHRAYLAQQKTTRNA